jgi:hypothetical protein
MSLFDPIQKQLNPTFWNGNILKPEVVVNLQNMLINFFPKKFINKMVMIGSTVTYQYNDESDVDINVIATEGQSYDTWHRIFKEHADTIKYPGTEHSVNFFFNEYSENPKFDNSLGAYDIQTKAWLKKPISPSILESKLELYDPIFSFAREYTHTADYILLSLARLINDLTKYPKDSEKYLGVLDEIKIRLEDLQYMYRSVIDKRKLAYRYRIGTPALQENNLTYKFIENSPQGGLLHLFDI